MAKGVKKKGLVLILGDQLTPDMPAIRQADPERDLVLMAEVREEATYARHHKKKIAFLFSAMRHFAEELAADSWTVDYVRLTDAENSGSIPGEIERAVSRHGCDEVLITAPGEWRLLSALEELRETSDAKLSIIEDDRFLCSRADFAAWADGRKSLRMEHFYREMRRKTGLLMEEDGEPAGGRWNFDAENRKPAKEGLDFESPKRFDPDKTTQEVLDLVESEFGDHFGALTPFWFGVTHKEADAAFAHFLKHGLERFGDYQDAMLANEKFLSHSVVSLYLNAGLLDPLEMCRQVEDAYRHGRVSLNSAEGFIRQIVGWREYVRGIYWLEMPDYGDRNFFGHTNALPDFYWTAETEMGCARACIEQTRDEAYAHHIQRLMVTGNLAMLLGVDPKAVHEWYLAVYADAYEWVELPNTLGMSQFADGGLLGSKPYAASGNYINRMSNYCSDCRYDVGEKVGEDACPFNYLYWDFLDRHRGKLEVNRRLGFAYATFEKMEDARKKAIRKDAASFIASVCGG